jgi:D-lactate dehydrogenase
MKRIAFFGVKEWERDLIEKETVRLGGEVALFEQEVQELVEKASEFEVLSVFIYSDLSKKILNKLPKLQLIASRSTGTDHIDRKECEKRGIKVMSVSEYGSVTVAEYAFALMIALSRRIVEANLAVRDGKFSPEGLTGVDLYGKTLGVVGVGKIGREMVKRGKVFGMKVVGVVRKRDKQEEKRLGYEAVLLEDCLARADFLSLHVPSTPETFHMLNKENLAKMKSGSYLINTSRGSVVEIEALLWALDEGILAGVGLDVTEEEAKVDDVGIVIKKRTTKDDLSEIVSYHLLRERPNVIFTPHNAFNTKEAIARIVKTTIDNILG